MHHSLLTVYFHIVHNREKDAENIYRDAASLNLTGSGYAWIVTEQALRPSNTPEGYCNYFTFVEQTNILCLAFCDCSKTLNFALFYFAVARQSWRYCNNNNKCL